MHLFTKNTLILHPKQRITIIYSHEMKNINIYTLTSELHDAQSVNQATEAFLNSLHVNFDLKGDDYSDYGTAALSVIFVRTGGTEGIFRQLLPQLQSASHDSKFYLLTSGKSNSLAASLEILSFLRQQGLQGEVIHGTTEHITHRLQILEQVELARKKLNGCRIGVIGRPSDWLISSTADYTAIKQKVGIDIIDIPMEELLNVIRQTPLQEDTTESLKTPCEKQIADALPGAEQIYHALKTLIDKHQLRGLTIRCFDLLTTVHNTGCIALAQLNAEGIVSGCEGDVPTLLTMMLTNAVTGVSGFQANPAHINPENGETLFAHCTIPLNMLEHYELDTHFESGIGVAIRGYMKPGPVTLFKVSGNLQRHFLAEGQLLRCEGKPDLCRTQEVILLNDASQARYFLTDPIGNHHVVVPGHVKEVMDELLNTINS